MREIEYEEIEAILIHATDAAVLLDIEGEEIWIPRSLIEDEGPIEEAMDRRPAEVLLSIARWNLKEMGP